MPIPVSQMKTGLLVPQFRPLTMASWTEAGQPTLSLAEIDKITKNRVPARRRFDSRFWIIRQRNSDCQGQATAGALGRSCYQRGGPKIRLSGEMVYAQCNGGRDRGSLLDDGRKVISDPIKGGTCPADMTDLSQWHWSEMSQQARDARKRFVAPLCLRVDTELELASGLARGFIGVIAVNAGGQYSRLDANGVRGASGGMGNHATGAQDVRVKGGQLQFDEFGSWGLENGDQGCAWVTWERTLQYTVNYHAFYLVCAGIDDPLAINPPKPRPAVNMLA